MNNIIQHPSAKELQDQVQNLKSGSGGGMFGDMEARVTRIESKMDKVEERLTSIEVLLARIDGRFDSINAKLDSKIDYKWMLFAVFAICALILREEIKALLSP